VDEGRAQQGRLVGGHHIGDAAMQFLEGEPDFATGQVGAETEVGAATAVAELGIRAAGDVEPPGVVELLLVAVG
jgi:hypothetical protein